MIDDPASSHGWCSLRLRFEARELELLRSAEKLRGTALAHDSRPDLLRTALSLAKAGRKLSNVQPGALVSLEEGELAQLLEAVRFAAEELQRVRRSTDAVEADAFGVAFPELVEKGAWRSFGLSRELDALVARLQAALNG